MKQLDFFLSPLKRLRRIFLYYRECFWDSTAYLKAATVLGFSGAYRDIQLESALVRRSHVLEKGLCMPDFRPRFGTANLIQLRGLLRNPDVIAGASSEQITAAQAVIEAYRNRHRELGIDISDILPESESFSTNECPLPMGGVKPFVPVTEQDSSSFFRLVNSRASLRNFDTSRIPSQGLIADCVAAAIRSPSVCNRQTWRVHAFTGEEASKVLELQNGNRGFGHKTPMVMVITSDMRQFSGNSERYQPWIEGGIFSMSLLLALHAKGLGAVSLNWSVLNDMDRNLRQLAKIPPFERIIVLIGCGYPAKDAVVPISHRRSVAEILFWH